MKKNLLILLPFIPYPLNNGGAQGTYNMINAIKDFFNIYLILPALPQDGSRMDLLSTKFEHKINIIPFYKKRTFKLDYKSFLRCFHYLSWKILNKNIDFQKEMLLWSDNNHNTFYDNEYLDKVTTIINEKGIDIIQIEFYDLLHLIYSIPEHVKKVFIHHEIRYIRNTCFFNGLYKPDSYDKYRLNRDRAEEICALNNYDLVVTLTDLDRNELKNVGVVTNIEYSPFFIPKENILEYKPGTTRLTFIGHGSHVPNKEGLEWFILKVFNLLLEQNKQLTLEIIGEWDKNYIKSIEKTNKHIIFHGFVNNIGSILNGSIMIVPILSGSGMRMKILEAVNYSCPFVTTSTGVMGLKFTNNESCFIADTPEDFCISILKLIENKNLQKMFVNESQLIYKKNYSSEALSTKRKNIILSI